MATQQELQEAFNLFALASNASGDFGRDYGNKKAKAAITDFNVAGGNERLTQLLNDPQIATEIAKLHRSGGLFDSLSTFAGESGVKEALMLGGAAMGLNAVGAFGTGGAGAATAAAPSATGMGAFTAEQLASPILAGGAGSGQGLSLATLGGAAPAASAIPGMASAAPSVAVPSTAGATIPAAGGVASAIPSFGGLSSNTLGSLASGAASLYGAQQGVNAAQDATGELRRQFDIGQANAKPWLEAGKSALGAQQELMGLGGQSPEQQLASLTNSPGYKFRFDQGQQARERSAAARGMLNSGNVLAGLTEYGQNFASNEYGNRLNQLAGLSGTGQTQANANMNAGMNYAGEMGNASLAAGNARMSGALGVGNALSNIFNPPKEQPTFKMVNGQWSYV